MTENEKGLRHWLYRLRWLIAIYLLVIPAAIWERHAVTNDDDASPLALSKSRLSAEPELTGQLAEVSSTLYPNRMSPHYWKGFHAFQGALYQDARRHFRAAIELNTKDESLLYVYAVTVAIMDENSLETKAAIQAWRWNYPHSEQPDPRETARQMHYYPRGIKALKAKEFAKAAQFFERDLISGRFSQELIYHYAVALILAGKGEKQIHDTIETWRSSYPDSTREDPRQAASRWK